MWAGREERSLKGKSPDGVEGGGGSVSQIFKAVTRQQGNPFSPSPQQRFQRLSRRPCAAGGRVPRGRRNLPCGRGQGRGAAPARRSAGAGPRPAGPAPPLGPCAAAAHWRGAASAARDTRSALTLVRGGPARSAPPSPRPAPGGAPAAVTMLRSLRACRRLLGSSAGLPARQPPPPAADRAPPRRAAMVSTPAGAGQGGGAVTSNCRRRGRRRRDSSPCATRRQLRGWRPPAGPRRVRSAAFTRGEGAGETLLPSRYQPCAARSRFRRGGCGPRPRPAPRARPDLRPWGWLAVSAVRSCPGGRPGGCGPRRERGRAAAGSRVGAG